MKNEHAIIIDELVKLLKSGGAHLSFQEAVNDLPAEIRGIKPENMPYSIWQLVEHIRIAQWDMLQFCINESHQSPKWPDEYWVREAEPKNDGAWNKSIIQINNDLEEFIEVLKKEDIYKELSHGNGQNILREALQIADHTSYHSGEIIAIRRMLKAWKNS
jgi:hypothetical protein